MGRLGFNGLAQTGESLQIIGSKNRQILMSE